MKLRTLTLMALVATIAALSTNFKMNPQNPPTAKTGAPGETTCETSGCHNGGNYKGTVTLSGVPDSVELGATYTLKLSTKSTGPKRNGFQMTCWTSTKAACGTFTNASNATNIATASLKQYIRQSNYKAFSGDSAVWTVSWKAPTVKNDSSFFYFSSLLANGNGNESSDNCLAGKKKIYFKKTSVSTIETAENSNVVSIKNNLYSNLLAVQLTENSGQLWIYNQQGQLIQSQVLSSDNQIDISALSKGVYVAIVKMGSREFSQRFMKM
ncbi:MAG: T9SS type A sorting domain-containing protein [Saprospiraceae bacterium]